MEQVILYQKAGGRFHLTIFPAAWTALILYASVNECRCPLGTAIELDFVFTVKEYAMKLKVLALAIALMSFVSLAVAEDVKSGLKVGEGIGPFNVTKLVGAEKDGVNAGTNLCYRCRNGARPQVMVFTRSSDEKVVSFVKKLDAELAKNSDKQLRAFVNYLGESKDSAAEAAKKLCATANAENVPFVVPNEFENGPEDYGLNAKAEVTILVAKEGKVVANHAFAKGKDLDIDSIVKDIEKAVN